MEALGRLFNAVPSETTTATWVNLSYSRGVDIFALTATSGNVTVQVAQDASGTNAINYDGTGGTDGITVYWTYASGVWTKHTQSAADTFTCATGGLAVAFVGGYQLPAGYDYINASHSSAHLLLVTTDLEVQRRPSSLASLIV